MIHWISLAAGALVAGGAQVPSEAAGTPGGAPQAAWAQEGAGGGGAGQAPPAAPAGEWADEWAEETVPLVGDAHGLRAVLECGRSPSVVEWRASLCGAPAGATVLVELGRARGDGLADVARQPLVADAQGRAELRWRGDLPAGGGVRFAARLASGAVVRTPVLAPPGGGLRAFVPQRGDLVITEIMKDPAFVPDSHGEWFEILNITNHPINIAGWKIADLGSNSHVLSNGGMPIVLLPGQRYLLGNDADPATNGGVPIDYAWSNFTLGNAADSILLWARRGDLVDEVDYDDGILWPDAAGKSISLHLFASDVYLNDDPMFWCAGKTALGGGNTDMGTPGYDNDTCP